MESYTVIGGGLAGLTAANALASDGKKVVLLERSQHLGGRAVTQQDRGYLLNLGPHALYADGIAARTLRRWNVSFSGNPPDTSSASFLMHDGRMYPLIVTTRQLLATRFFSAAEKWQAARLLQKFGSGRAAAEESMEAWIDRNARSARVRQFGAMLIRLTTYSAALAQLSARAALDQFRLARARGVLYLDGGWQTLVAGLEQRARALGVEIRLGEAVESLDAFRGTNVILALPPSSVERITGRRLPGLQPARMACLDLGLRQLPGSAARVVFGVDQPLYLSVHSTAARLAPAGSPAARPALVHLGKYLAPESAAAADLRELEQLADRAIPGWRDRAEVVRFLPNMTVTHAVFGPGGRPAVDALAALGLDGVALAGDWVGSEGMLADAAVASGLRAAGMVQRQQLRAA